MSLFSKNILWFFLSIGHLYSQYYEIGDTIANFGADICANGDGSWDFNGDKGAREYKIHEVFSDETGIVGYSAEGIAPFGESKKELLLDLSYMARAFQKPVLDVEDLPTTKFGE